MPQYGLDAILDLLAAKNTGRVDIADTWADLVLASEFLESAEQLHVTLGGFDRDDIGIEALNRREDIVEVGVAQVRVSLGDAFGTGGSKAERVDNPGKVGVPIDPAKRKLEYSA